MLITEVATGPEFLADHLKLVPKDFTIIMEKFGPVSEHFHLLQTGSRSTSTAPLP